MWRIRCASPDHDAALFLEPVRQRPPAGGGLHLQFRQRHRSPAEILVRVEADFLEHRHDRRRQHLAARARPGAVGPLLELVEHLEAGGQVGVGVVADVHAAHIALLVVKVELLHLILRALVHVNGILVQQHRHGKAVHRSARMTRCFFGSVMSTRVLVRRRAQVDARLGKLLRHPIVAPADAAQDVFVLEVAQQFRRLLKVREALAFLEGQLVGGALDVVEQDVEVVRIDQRLLRRLTEKSSPGG